MRFDDALIENLLDRNHFIEEEKRKDLEKVKAHDSEEGTGEEKAGFFSSFNVAQIWKEGLTSFSL